MKTVIQRVKYASVTIEGEVHGKINQGYMILVGIKNEDTPEIVSKMADKIAGLRIFEDDNGKMNLNLEQVGGALLILLALTVARERHVSA